MDGVPFGSSVTKVSKNGMEPSVCVSSFKGPFPNVFHVNVDCEGTHWGSHNQSLHLFAIITLEEEVGSAEDKLF